MAIKPIFTNNTLNEKQWKIRQGCTAWTVVFEYRKKISMRFILLQNFSKKLCMVEYMKIKTTEKMISKIKNEMVTK